jgi:diacylglycerol O-acyltransferase
MSLKPLSPLDQMFLLLERRTQAMHVGGLELLTPPKGAKAGWLDRQLARLREATQPKAPFNQRLTRRLGSWHWIEDERFDLGAHLHHHALPQPGRIRELLALVSELHAVPLDRARPLWEFHVIEGLEDGRFAIYAKIHHAMVDGIAAMRMLRKALSEDVAADTPPPWTTARRKPAGDAPPQGALSNTALLMANFREQAASLPAVSRELYRAIREGRDNPDHVSAFQAPRCILNQRISSARRFAAQSYDLPRIRAIGKAHRVTVNTIVLAMCGSALRRYLLDLDALPAKPLIAMVPLSLRRDDSDEGNQIAMILARLGTDLADPLERLAQIQRSVEDARSRCARMGPTATVNYVATVMAPAGINIATGIAPRWQSFNVIISNVPGPKRPLHWNGARLDGMYPVSIITSGLALNITLTSYVDKLEFGVIACPRALPHVQRLLDYFEQGLAELETPAAAPTAATVAEKTPTRKRTRKTA